MIPWERLDGADVPNTTQRLELWRRGDEYVIRVDNQELMGSRTHGSEDALAQLALATLTPERRATSRVLIGGLGMGFTLAAALREAGPQAQVIVAELVPAVIAWSRGLLGHIAGHPLDDPRAATHEGDVADLIKQPADGFDAILLDVDNGPDWLTREDNAWLYGPRGLAAIERALRLGGTLAIWSASDDQSFSKRLRATALTVSQHTARGHNGKGRRHTIWLATRSLDR